MQKTNPKEFRIENVIKKKGNKIYVRCKGYDNSFNSWIYKNYLKEMNQYFPEPSEPFGGDINVKVNLSYYAAKTNFKNATEIHTCKLAAKSDLFRLKAEVDKLDMGKLVTVPVDLSNLSDLVKNDLVKKLYIINYLQNKIILILVNLFEKLNTTQTSQI